MSAETTRTYTLRKRALAMEETKRRITEAAVELHGTVGPARSTISAIADRAGVQRHTVYRHFPTEDDLYAACSAHYSAANPLPDIEAWAAIADPAQRIAHGLDELYAFWERTEPMWTNVLRDAKQMEVVQRTSRPLLDYLDEAARVLADGSRRRIVLAATRHAVAFETWRSLAVDGGLPRAQAVELTSAMIEAAAA
jgi:AcrR family transcriptional regulator